MSNDKFWEFFFEIYETIPRQGPGERESTERALRSLPPLDDEKRILDIGCGTGAQTLDIATATTAQIVAVDRHTPFLERLRQQADEAGLADRIDVQVGDMNDLAVPDASFDAVWSEGAIFIIGFEQGLRSWRRLLKPGGHLVVSEFCWFTNDPPAELREMFLGDCDEPEGVASRLAVAAASGYRLVDQFVLPEAAWRDNYHAPLSARLDHFEEKYAGKDEALAVAAHCRREIELRRKHPDAYGYVFFVLQRDEG